MKFFLTIFFSLVFNIISYGQVHLLSISNDLDSPPDSLPWTNLQTSVKGSAFSGENYSSTDSVKQWGLGYKGSLPVTVRNKNLKVKFSENVRTNIPGKEFLMVIEVKVADSVVLWESKNISARVQSAGKWTKLEDSFELPATLTGNEYVLAIYLWNKDGKSVVDVDDLKIDFEEMQMPSFLPQGFVKSDIVTGWSKISSTKDFSFYYNKESGFIKVVNSSGDTLINSLGIFTEWIDDKSKTKKETWNYHLYFRTDSSAEEGYYIRFTARDELSESDFSILIGDQKNLSFSISTVFKKDITLIRQSIAVSFSLPVKEVYKKSTLTDAIIASKEYWLDKEGFLLSNSRSSILFYRPANVSSVQLDAANKIAYINQDYAADHPMLHFPLLKKNQNLFEDYSTSVYKKEDTLKSSFTFYSVKPEFKMAKMLANPFGYLASFTWTEHADYTNLRTQRAVYFGSEKISRLEDATGGFLKYSIPVTKSIFYSNPDKVDNAEKAGFMPGAVATYKETEGYRNFLKQLDEYGMEICLHTPDHYTCDKKLLAEALDVTRKEFSPVTWIDHGYDNSMKSNREDLACDGFDEKSKWYSADLWKKYNIKYFWNSFYEDSDMYGDYSFNSFFSKPYSGMDDAFPTPVYWRSKTRTADAIHWRTTSTTDPADGSLWSYYYNDLRLSDMVHNRNSIIIHSYPARVDSTNGFYEFKDSVIVANDEFNNALAKLSSYRSQEKIWLTTVRDLLNYRTSIENVTYEITPEGKIRLHNNSKEIIRGISFSTKASEVKADKKEILTKRADDELIFWLDMLPGETVYLSLN